MNAILGNKRLQLLAPWVVPILLILIWQILVQLGWISTRILPAPTAVFRAGFELASTGQLSKHIWVSTVRALWGFLIGGSIGFGLGLLNGIFRWSELLLDTSIQMLRNIPHLAMIPLVILWFGIGDAGRVFLVAIGVLFPIYVNTYLGIRT